HHPGALPRPATARVFWWIGAACYQTWARARARKFDAWDRNFLEPVAQTGSLTPARGRALRSIRRSSMRAGLLLTSIIPVALLSGGALATPVFVGHINFADSYGSTGGGEFHAWGQADFTLNPARTGTPFQGGVPAAA